MDAPRGGDASRPTEQLHGVAVRLARPGEVAGVYKLSTGELLAVARVLG